MTADTPPPGFEFDIARTVIALVLDVESKVHLIPGLDEEGVPRVTQAQAVEVLSQVVDTMRARTRPDGTYHHTEEEVAEREAARVDRRERSADLWAVIHAAAVEDAWSQVGEAVEEMPEGARAAFTAAIELGAMQGMKHATRHLSVSHLRIDPDTGLPLPDPEGGPS